MSSAYQLFAFTACYFFTSYILATQGNVNFYQLSKNMTIHDHTLCPKGSHIIIYLKGTKQLYSQIFFLCAAQYFGGFLEFFFMTRKLVNMILGKKTKNRKASCGKSLLNRFLVDGHSKCTKSILRIPVEVHSQSIIYQILSNPIRNHLHFQYSQVLGHWLTRIYHSWFNTNPCSPLKCFSPKESPPLGFTLPGPVTNFKTSSHSALNLVLLFCMVPV